MRTVFAPGCAMMIYKPELAGKIMNFFEKDKLNVSQYLTCCKHTPELEDSTQIINTCAGCDRRYRELYLNVSTISLWEILARSNTFPFIDYKGKQMTIWLKLLSPAFAL